MQTLTATKRSKADKLGNMRSNGIIPAVVYGARVENTPISVSSILFEKIFKIVGESSTVVLEVANEGGKIQKFDVLIHDVQVDPVKGFPIHVDFLAIDMNKPVQVAIPLEFTGTAQAEKDSVGVLVKVLYEVEIEALPKDLPHSIIVDVTSLATLDSQIHVSDLKLPAGVTAISSGDDAVALISAVKEEVEEEAPIDLSAIEVEKKGKKDEEGEAETAVKE